MPQGREEVISNITKPGKCGGMRSYAQPVCGPGSLTSPQDYKEYMVEKYKERRDVMVTRLNAIPGMSCSAPKAGAFYAFEYQESSFDIRRVCRQASRRKTGGGSSGNCFW